MNYIQNNGPFYGAVGYSQGAAMIMVLLRYTSITFNKIVLYTGYNPFNPIDSSEFKLTEEPLIFIGNNDVVFLFPAGVIVRKGRGPIRLGCAA